MKRAKLRVLQPCWPCLFFFPYLPSYVCTGSSFSHYYILSLFRFLYSNHPAFFFFLVHADLAVAMQLCLRSPFVVSLSDARKTDNPTTLADASLWLAIGVSKPFSASFSQTTSYSDSVTFLPSRTSIWLLAWVNIKDPLRVSKTLFAKQWCTSEELLRTSIKVPPIDLFFVFSCRAIV